MCRWAWLSVIVDKMFSRWRNRVIWRSRLQSFMWELWTAQVKLWMIWINTRKEQEDMVADRTDTYIHAGWLLGRAECGKFNKGECCLLPSVRVREFCGRKFLSTSIYTYDVLDNGVVQEPKKEEENPVSISIVHMMMLKWLVWGNYNAKL